MLVYYCAICNFYYQELELLLNKKCPECKEGVKTRLMLGGQVMGE